MFVGCRGLEKDRLEGGEGNEAGLKEAAGIGFVPSRLPCVVLIGEEGNVGRGAGEFGVELCAPDASSLKILPHTSSSQEASPCFFKLAFVLAGEAAPAPPPTRLSKSTAPAKL